MTRYETAQHELDRLGPIRRRLHPTQRQTLEANVADAKQQVAVLDTKSRRLTVRSTRSNRKSRSWTAWTTTHARELERLDFLDDQVRINDRMDAIAHRSRARTLEHDLGLSIEL